MKKIWKIILVSLLVIAVTFSGFQVWNNHKGKSQTDLKFVFVHGLSGWGHYDTVNYFMPYWGLSGGSITKFLGRKGYDCYEASVSPQGSAWDRACELYAELTGSRVDYGEEHSKRCHHERFGEDYSKKPLMKDFNESRIVLIGHSFGGATIRLFSEILRNGSAEEQKVSGADDLSPFFKGGNENRIFAIVTLASPSNGTTAYDLYEDPDFDVSKIDIPEKYLKASETMSKGTKAKKDGRIDEDYASFDMHIDHADELNKKITTFDNIYYFAYPCCSTLVSSEGEKMPNENITEKLFMKSAILMSRYTGKTKGKMIIDESWQSNDGLVNEVSAMAPSYAPSKKYVEGETILPGMYIVMPTHIGDHMYFQGGLTKRVNIKPFYLELVQMIRSLQ